MGWRVASETSTPHVEGDRARLGLFSSFRLIWTHLDLFRLIQALLSSELISVHVSLAKFYLDWTAFGRRIPQWREGGPFEGELGFHPLRRGPLFFLDWSFEHQFNSTLSETIGKWVLLMWGVGTLWGAVITDKITKLKVAYQCGLLLHNYSSNKMGPWVTFSGIKEKLFDSSTPLLICLKSSSDSSRLACTRLQLSSGSSTLLYTHLVTRLHSYTFVCDSSTFVYTRLHSSSGSSVFLE